MRLVRTFIILMLPILWGCGGVKVILKSPVESKCGSAGLQGCPELTDGVLLYVEGDEVKGKDMLVKGAAENAPKKVKKFAKHIKLLKKIPGAEKYTAKLVEIAKILTDASKNSKVAAAPGDNAADNAADDGAGADEDEDMKAVKQISQ